MADFDLNVETMSRNELEAAYFEAVSRYEIANVPVKNDPLRNYLREEIGMAPRMAKFVELLMDGRPRNYSAIAIHISDTPIEDQAHTAGGTPQISRVTSCQVRKLLKPYGVKIRTIWGRGYVLDSSEIQKLNKLVNESKFQLTPIAEG